MTKALREGTRVGLANFATGVLNIPGLESRPGTPPERVRMAAPPNSRAGRLTFEGDYATLTFERSIRHPVEAVWAALTDPEHLALWYMTDARIDPRLGGTIDYRSGPARLHVTGKILTWEPPRVFEHEWNVEPRKDFPTGESSIVRWELTPVGEATFLRFSHRRLTRQTAIVFSGGMHAFLDRLEDHLDARPLGDWLVRVQEVRSNYPSWGSGGKTGP